MIKRFARNVAGRDFVVGDIHGCFTRLQANLDAIGFDPARDRLFSVGDLVDRGPESALALEWLAKPWFHAVRGNHEQMAIDWALCDRMDPQVYAMNGGAWNIGNTPAERMEFAAAFGALPIAIELETADGLVGIVHADCPVSEWGDLEPALTGPDAEAFISTCLWSRTRFNNHFGYGVEGVRAVVVGHTPVERWTSLGNVIYIDTGAVFRGRDFTILDAATLQPVALPGKVLDWAS